MPDDFKSHSTSQSPPKKQRSERVQPRSKVLHLDAEQAQFVSILEAVRNSPLVLKADNVVPLCIIKEIAECSTGYVKECANPNRDRK